MTKNQNSGRASDEALVEAIDRSYRPEPLLPLRRARIRARVRDRVEGREGLREGGRRSGWGIVPAAAALVGVLVAITFLLVSSPMAPRGLDPFAENEIPTSSLLLMDEPLVTGPIGPAGPGPDVLPDDYDAILLLLEERT